MREFINLMKSKNSSTHSLPLVSFITSYPSGDIVRSVTRQGKRVLHEGFDKNCVL